MTPMVARPPDEAVMRTRPFLIAVTSPDEFTVARVTSDDDHVTVDAGVVLPFSSVTLAVSCCVLPRSRLVESRDIVSENAGAFTTYFTESTTARKVRATMYVELLEHWAFTRPVLLTVATDVFLDVQPTVVLGTVTPAEF